MIDQNIFLISWLVLALALALINIIGVQKNKVNSFFILILYFFAGLTSVNYNDDIGNYYVVYKGMTQFAPLAWNFEPGFNFILYLFNKMTISSELGFFLIRILPGIILSIAIWKDKFHPSFAVFYICSIGLVLSSTTLRASYAFSFLCLALTWDTSRVKHVLPFIPAAMTHMSSIPVVTSMILHKVKFKNLVILSLLAICLLTFPIIQSMVDIAFSKLSDRGSILRSSIPFRSIQIFFVVVILVFLFPNNGKYIFEKIGYVGLLTFSIIWLVSVHNYGLSRVLLYCYPFLFLRATNVRNLRSLNQLICLISLPSAIYFFLEFK